MNRDFGERRQARIDRFNKEEKQKIDGSEERIGFASSERNQSLIPDINQGERSYRNPLDHNDHKAGKAFGEEAFKKQKPTKANSPQPAVSEDLKAIQNLTAKIEEAQEEQDRMVKANQLLRQGDIKGLVHLLGEDLAAQIQRPHFLNHIGFPQYKIMDNRAQIGSMKEALEDLQDMIEEESIEYEINGTRILENPEENKLQIIFESKPDEEIRARLKENGFHWARAEGAWQRHLNDTARYAAECALKPD